MTREEEEQTFQGILTYSFVEVLIPHIVDRASRTTHDERPETKKADISQVCGQRHTERVGGHRDRPC